jgi:hypothetical protein
LPFSDTSFDYVLSWNVIHHGTLGDLGRRLGEIWLVLRSSGLLQVTVLSTRDANYGIGREITSDTFVIDQVERNGHPHCYCDAAMLVGLLAGFDLPLSASNFKSGDPTRTTGTSSPNVAAESGFRGVDLGHQGPGGRAPCAPACLSALRRRRLRAGRLGFWARDGTPKRRNAPLRYCGGVTSRRVTPYGPWLPGSRATLVRYRSR